MGSDLKKLNPEVLIFKLREAVSPKGRKALWLRDLSDDQLIEVYYRLKLGHTNDRIMEEVRKWGCAQGVSDNGLYKGLRKFRDKTVPDMAPIQSKQSMTTKEQEYRSRFILKGKKIHRKLDVLGMQAKVLQGLWDTFVLYGEKEKLYNQPFRSKVKAGEVLFDKLVLFQNELIKMGIIESKPTQEQLMRKEAFEKLVGGLTDGGAVVVAGIRNFLQLATASAVELEEEEDGTFTMRRPGHESK